VHFLVESTAAAAAYGLAVAGRKTVLVVDMGGGTTDLSVVRVEDGVFTVRATGGNNSLGGNNIDAALLELVLRKAAALPGLFCGWITA
jgi:molecular chaperone HscA